MAVSILAINNIVGQASEFTLTVPTLVWVHGGAGTNVMVGLDIKGSDGVFTEIEIMTAQGSKRSGTLPAGDYRVTRLGGVCGFQRAA